MYYSLLNQSCMIVYLGVSNFVAINQAVVNFHMYTFVYLSDYPWDQRSRGRSR